MRRKMLSFILAVVFVFSAIPAIPVAAATAWDGASTSEPTLVDGIYQISSGAELAWFAEATKTDGSLHAVLTADIDLNGKEWSPIGIPASGYVSEAFSGTFDGQGHTVSNVKIDTNQAFYGLFYCVYGGTVKNLSVTGDVSTTGSTAGGIVGKLQGGTIENCSFEGTVSASKNYVGGIVGNIQSNSKTASEIKGCCNGGNVTGQYAGGILGYTTAKATISHCYNIGTIDGKTRSAGISGQQTSGTICYCYNIGKSSSGISGFSNAAITNCYYLNETVAPGGTATGYQQITDKATLLGNLNADGENKFVADTKNNNNGYPILSWQDKLTPEEEQKKKEDAEKVKQAVNELSIATSPIKEVCKLNLPSEIGGCSIVWTSSNADIISNQGAVTLPEKDMVTVTMTANIRCGESSADKDFEICVWPKNMDANVYLQKVLTAMEWNFKQLQPAYGQDTNIIVKFQNLLKSKGFDDVAVTIESTADENLISKTGRISYPELDRNSYANGKQVKISFSLSYGGETVTYPDSDNNALLIPWDTSSVRNELETSADEQLSERIIAGMDNNDALNSVSANLNLPSNIGKNGGKYSFAWVTWESSDINHINISDENRKGGADALYNAYVGKIQQDGGEHTVNLTATIENPSTGVAIQREFTVTVAPLSDGILEQTLDKMNAILSCYTADKLADSATKEKLNINAVDHDIQLVIPKNVVTADELAKLDYGKYWDYWNYKFTVTSSDTNVIEINAFRAVVYRPLGEDASADKQVTLTVKMESRENPNLFVTKKIPVTVKHLSREDINSQLDLMDKAKDNYANGLLGNNSDVYSIIDNLSPYWEIVWNKEKSGVDFIRTHSGMQGNGIIVDTLPGWEEQEDWRLFRTSNRDLISNETLILNGVPGKNTFVKINSVLTDESLGKYYEKFKDDKEFDKEALVKFKQLYKQPVSAYVMVVGAENYTKDFACMTAASKAAVYGKALSTFKEELDKPITVSFTLLGLDGAPIIKKTAINSFTKGATVFDVFKKVLADNHINYQAKGSYITTINGLAEKDHGANSGWMYSVDGVFVNSYMNAQELSGGENIIVMYAKDYKDANKQNNNAAGNDGGNGQSNASKDHGNGADKINTDTVSGSDNAKNADKSDNGNQPVTAEDENNQNDVEQAESNDGNDSTKESRDSAIGNNDDDKDSVASSKGIILSVIAALVLASMIVCFVWKKKKKNP